MGQSWGKDEKWFLVANQEGGYKTGMALINHIVNAHNGEVDPNCSACKEIQRKTEEAKRGTRSDM